MTYPKDYSPTPKGEVPSGDGGKDKDNAGISPGHKRRSRLAILIVIIIIVVAFLSVIIKSYIK